MARRGVEEWEGSRSRLSTAGLCAGVVRAGRWRLSRVPSGLARMSGMAGLGSRGCVSRRTGSGVMVVGW